MAEVLVATVILGVGMLALAGLIATAIGRQTRATIVQEMTTLAEGKLEELRAFSMIGASDTMQVTLGGSLTADAANHSDVAASPVGRKYTRRWAVAAAAAGTRSISLRISPIQAHKRHLVAPMEFSTLMLVVR